MSADTTFLRLLGLACFAWGAACTPTSSQSDSGCSVNTDCDSGEVCVDGGCEQVCSNDFQCKAEATACIDGTCKPCEGCRDVPRVSGIDGTGSEDGVDDYSSRRLRDRLVLEGTNLEGALVTISGGRYDRRQLERCGDGADRELQVGLPGDIEPGTYELTVANQAGSCNTSVQLLRGEPGSYEIGSGLQLSGDETLSVAFDENTNSQAVAAVEGASSLALQKIKVASTLSVGSASACDSDAKGAIRWTGEQLEVCLGDDTWRPLAWQPGDGTSRTSPARSCWSIKQQNRSASNGVYWLDPDGPPHDDALQLYCDMTGDGGGWTLIGKVASGDYRALSDQEYIDLVANPIEHVAPNLLQNGDAPADGRMAFLNREFTNALFWSSDVQVVRVELVDDGRSDSSNEGVYYQRRVDPPGDWDFWHAMRDSRLWGTSTDGSDVEDFGTDFLLNKGSETYNPWTNTFAHGGDGSFGWWDAAELELTDGSTLSVSRHAGLLCDGYGNTGGQWLLTLNINDDSNRWKNDTRKKSIIWLK